MKRILIADSKWLNPTKTLIRWANLDRPRYIFFPFWHWKIPKEIYQPYECVVFHLTDLPFGRGGMPYENLIKLGIYDTKVTAFRAVEEMDAGPVYMKRLFTITDSKEETIRRVERLILYEMIPYIVNNDLIPVPQTGRVTKFRRFKCI